MNTAISNPLNVQTMSSLEIAKLTGKQHYHILRDIKVMLDELKVNQSKFELVDFLGTYKDAKGEERPCYNLPKRECLILVSGYSIQMRAAIIDRWQLLEQQAKGFAVLDGITIEDIVGNDTATTLKLAHMKWQQAIMYDPDTMNRHTIALTAPEITALSNLIAGFEVAAQERSEMLSAAIEYLPEDYYLWEQLNIAHKSTKLLSQICIANNSKPIFTTQYKGQQLKFYHSSILQVYACNVELMMAGGVGSLPADHIYARAEFISLEEALNIATTEIELLLPLGA